MASAIAPEPIKAILLSITVAPFICMLNAGMWTPHYITEYLWAWHIMQIFPSQLAQVVACFEL